MLVTFFEVKVNLDSKDLLKDSNRSMKGKYVRTI